MKIGNKRGKSNIFFIRVYYKYFSLQVSLTIKYYLHLNITYIYLSVVNKNKMTLFLMI